MESQNTSNSQSNLILVSKTGVLENPSTKLLNTAVHPEKHLLATRWPAQALYNDNECQRLGLDRTTYTLDQPAYRETQGRQYNMPHLEQRRKVKPSHPLQRREHRCTKELLQLPMRCSIRQGCRLVPKRRSPHFVSRSGLTLHRVPVHHDHTRQCIKSTKWSTHGKDGSGSDSWSSDVRA